MKQLIITMYLISGSFFSIAQSVSPEVVAASGDYNEGSGVTISWTLGEIMTETYSGTDINLTQGFQQSSYSITSVEEYLPEALSVTVYPNPATDKVFMNIRGSETTRIKVELFDLQGKTIHSQVFDNIPQIIEMNLTPYANSAYLLKITDTGSTKCNTYKIQKIG
ncbi:MAG: T9SS type A sorting domain-containing protein [Bacteroidetes bacterium]|nr:T9SS type A sorting domain-containing protein [Bacteroidota bacterium]